MGLFPSPLTDRHCHFPHVTTFLPTLPACLLRVVLGLTTLYVMRIVCKRTFTAITLAAFKFESVEQLCAHNKAAIFRQFGTYFTLSLISMIGLPIVFRMLGLSVDFYMDGE
jgi:hypothetical protein